jgi:chromate transporter
MTVADWLDLFAYYVSISLLGIGGVIGTAPDMQRYLVVRQGWLTDPQFSASIAIAQAAPGPNILFVALLGWHVGLHAGAGGPAWLAQLLGLLGAMVTMVGIMLPSTTLTWFAARWGQRNRERRAVRAFKQGMAPIVIGLLIATAWILGSAHGDWHQDWRLWLLTIAATVVMWRTRVHLLWLLGAGAVLGAFGFI